MSSDLLTLQTAVGIPPAREAPRWFGPSRYSTLGLERAMPKAQVMEQPPDGLRSAALAQALNREIKEIGEGPAVLCLQMAVETLWGHAVLNCDGVLGPGTVAIANRLPEQSLLASFEDWIRIWKRGTE